MCGIWKLSHPSFKFPSSPDTKEEEEEEVVLRLNDDGTFDPYTPILDETRTPEDNLKGILGRGGCWEYRDDTLILAADRPEKLDPSKIHDTLFMGKLDVHISKSMQLDESSVELLDGKEEISKAEESTPPATNAANEIDVHLSIPQGRIDIGKFMYPKKHKAFFEEPMLFKRSNVGSFQMNQVLGNLNARLKHKKEAPPKPEPKFRKADFHNRTFYLTTAPHPVNPKFAELDVHYDEAKATLDVRIMPITFHSNNTFTAVGTEKILRGRFDITGEGGDALYFRVSLFGFGRSVSGSVFSEGRLLSQDDRRAYRGNIQSYEQNNNQTRMFVKGEFYYGLGIEALRKSNSMGTFTLQEIDDDTTLDDDDEEDEFEDCWLEGGSSNDIDACEEGGSAFQ